MSSCPTKTYGVLSATQNLALAIHSVRPSLRERPGSIGISQLNSSMNAKLNKGGRPPMAEGKRSKKIDVRFTEGEYNLILQWENTLGITKTELIRGRTLQNTPEVIINAKSLIAEIDAIGTELGRCGNNINQLARYANILNKRNKLLPSVIDDFNRLFTEYLRRVDVLEATLRKVLRSRI